VYTIQDRTRYNVLWWE